MIGIILTGEFVEIPKPSSIVTFRGSNWSPFDGSSDIHNEGIEVTCFGDTEREFLLGIPSSSVYVNAWRCHYCGSLYHESDLKCPSCGGERRT